MKIAVAHLKSESIYSQSKHYEVPKLKGELPKDYEERTWRNRMHADETGHVMIPPTAFANCIKDAAKYMSLKIPGKQMATYTKHFDAGILVSVPLVLPVKVDDIKGQWLFVPSDGKPGGGKRVMKCFPVIEKWEGDVTFYILDDVITEDIFRQVLTTAGMLIGIGYFRPIRRGYWGRFSLGEVKWSIS